MRGKVAFRDVKFRYEDPGRPILDGISLEVKAGQTLAIVGPSGSGKTTLVALVMRFYDPQEGSTELDGHDLRTLKQRSLRRKIGVVLQDPLLFNDSIRNNIAYGRPEATRAEIESAAKAANAHDFILRLPEGYDTSAGERGTRLSVGERQRITIARALIKDPPLGTLLVISAKPPRHQGLARLPWIVGEPHWRAPRVWQRRRGGEKVTADEFLLFLESVFNYGKSGHPAWPREWF